MLCVQSYASPQQWELSFGTRGPNGGIENAVQWGWHVASADGELAITPLGSNFQWDIVYWKVTLLFLAVPLWPLLKIWGDDLRAMPQRSPEYAMAGVGREEQAVQSRILDYESSRDRLKARIGWWAARRFTLVWFIGNVLLFIASFDLLDDLHGVAFAFEAITLNALILFFGIRLRAVIARTAGRLESALYVVAAILLPAITLGAVFWAIFV